MARPTRKSLSSTTPHTKAADLRPQKAGVDELVRKISELVLKSPGKAGSVLEQWLQESEKAVKKKKSA